ncbi:DUF892 family protein [Notoacmeibacter ruber]|uniref:DUF892 family protein n=1 Tax=Notoacmeibacter ruber TaxID=2670375 RepID=A0A3L7JG64_9HYPH|nr:DUF892 family protein [Notoacmeibacter ruber]RLQ89305.1 DUF892 family protein [Notoacmeibacter ruber]
MAIANLKDVYVDQLQDIFSACHQSSKVTAELKDKADNSELQDALSAGVKGIENGMEVLRSIIKAHDADPKGEFCKGMEGLVKEARSHGIEQDIDDADARDAMIITQYQRMAHYAIAGYGCLVAFARRLELNDEADRLQDCLNETYEGDRHMTDIAMGGVNKAAV